MEYSRFTVRYREVRIHTHEVSAVSRSEADKMIKVLIPEEKGGTTYEIIDVVEEPKGKIMIKAPLPTWLQPSIDMHGEDHVRKALEAIVSRHCHKLGG